LTRDPEAAVVTYLVNKGIAANRLSSEGYGGTKPESTNQTDEGRALSRLFEFTIISN
jgi:outer membrane protein OmpA-like peptidoglycan-associated protein